ncbi:response regulator [Desulfobacca acetoxidans]|uniref:Response regulator receiver protein n=1 Tax=Desulfobacca acetoxidans (strain ATCC 700848 / DSM 11109 / ASRB2) TaxID=880072 RepID=F2NHN1_DESAR|nr:response regulator [Desulfobacca acetoxidans]AEB09218.1 response regulator receiver protein [Desulfobacca acetoxidans DSM 11109]HAY22369.1 response regulator [Desulfobacterales bacterium]
MAVKVLVVDDDQWTRMALEDILRRAGYEVKSLASGLGLEDMLSGESFAAAIIDYHLPISNGLEIAQSLRERWPDCRTILISSEYQPWRHAEGLPAVVDRFLIKPFSKSDLLEVMTALCPPPEPRIA